MPLYYLSRHRWLDFLDILGKDYQIYLPSAIEEKGVPCDFNYDLFASEFKLFRYFSSERNFEFVFNKYRTIEPLKTFFTLPREKISPSYKKEDNFAIIGVKNCDLFSLKIQDYVFMEGVVSDPYYRRRRESSLIISGDCIAFKEVCFCLALGIKPYPQEGFDLNLSPLEEGFLVEAGSVKGEGMVRKIKDFFLLADAEQVAIRDKNRREVVKNLNQHLSFYNIPPRENLQKIVKEGFGSALWQEEALRCVECGGCNFSCNTCHCFLLSEDRFGNVHEKMRLWDACLYANFAKVAGGANPLEYRYQRLRNRFLKKFDFFPDNLGIPACSGCGRCIEVCPAKIDIRKILRELNTVCSR